MLSFDIDVSRRLGTRTIAARFAAGSGLTALFGHSGAGKTAILDMVAGLLTPDAGRIVVGGAVLFDSAAGIDVPANRRRAGYVFQDHRLFPHQRVRGNIAYGWDLADAADRWMTPGEAARFLGIAHLLQRWPRTLSGGEAQRVAIGRALASGARFLLMDEPLAALDAARRDEILTLIERLRDELALPILYVSHDRAEIDRLTQTVIEIA